MPFTFSHPALVLPAKYLPAKWVSMTALIVGSVTPDFEYLIRLKEESTYTHTLAGMFWLDLPAALLLTFIYHYIVRDVFIANSPVFFRKRFSPYMHFDWGNYFKHHFFIVISCLLVGIASHLFWDSFTHPEGYFVRIIPFLKQTSHIAGIRFQNARLLQIVSTILGAAIVLYAIVRMPATNQYPATDSLPDYWLIIAGMGIIVICILMVEYKYRIGIKDIAISLLSGMVAGAIIAPAFIPYTRKPG